MRFSTAIIAAALGAALPGCSCGVGPCGQCRGATACDAATKTCVPAIAAGQPCQDDAGNPLPQPCQDGTSCQSAVSPAVCAEACNPAALPTTCPVPDECWEALDSSGAPVLNPDGTAQGYCGGIAESGQECGPVGLAFCDPNQSLSCVIFTQGAADGVCFTPCDPQAGGQCAQPQQCLGVFADATLGICAIPQPPDAGCVQAEGFFCPQGQICLDPGDGGSCFTRCTPNGAGECAPPQSCLTPDPTNPTLGICAVAVPRGGACDPLSGYFCDQADLCIIGADGGADCHEDCTAGEPCPAGQSCLQITGSSSLACG